MHYQRWRKHGDPELLVYHSTPEKSFDAKVKWRGDCLVWTGSLNRKGYGQIRVRGKTVSAHRFAWTRLNGAIPSGMQIDHRCHNRACVNVEHLRLATAGQNAANLGRLKSNNMSGYRNVHRAADDRWVVSVQRDGTAHYFGRYGTPEEADTVAKAARQRLFGEFAGSQGGNAPQSSSTLTHYDMTLPEEE